MDPKQKENVLTFLYMSLNVICVVSIVICNKILYQELGFVFGNTLMMIHFAFTGLCLYISSTIFKMFEKKCPPFHEILKLSLCQVASVAFVNQSLLYLSVGLYQVLKIMNIPVLCVMEYYWLGKTKTRQILASLFVVCGGIALATVTDLQFNAVGFVHGVLATIATGAYQILANKKQSEYKVSANQLLYYQAPVTTVLLGVCALIGDNIFGENGLTSFVFTPRVVWWIVLSGFISYGVNLSVYLILGRASPVTYNIVGHFKTCAVIFFGFVVLHQPFDSRNFLGILVALLGIFWYTYLTLPGAATPSGGSASPSTPSDTTSRLFRAAGAKHTDALPGITMGGGPDLEAGKGDSARP